MGVIQAFKHHVNVKRELTVGEDELGNPAWRNVVVVWSNEDCHIFQAKGSLLDGSPGSPPSKQTKKNVWRMMHSLRCPVSPLDTVEWVETGRKFRAVASVEYGTHIETDLEDIGGV